MYEMLRPRGQFFICTFSETPIDTIFEQLDKGEWAKYDHFKSNSPFYKNQNVVEEYRRIMEEVGFDVNHIQAQPDSAMRFSEEGLEGKKIICNNFYNENIIYYNNAHVSPITVFVRRDGEIFYVTFLIRYSQLVWSFF